MQGLKIQRRQNLVGSSGLEPPTSRLSGVRSNLLSYEPISLAVSLFRSALFPLGWWRWTGSNRWPPACKAGALPAELHPHFSPKVSWTFKIKQRFKSLELTLDVKRIFFTSFALHRKEVIQPHLPIRLPCYDFTPVAYPTFGCVLLAVKLQTSGVTNSHGVTGGVYKTRERIHRSMLICDY